MLRKITLLLRLAVHSNFISRRAYFTTKTCLFKFHPLKSLLFMLCYKRLLCYWDWQSFRISSPEELTLLLKTSSVPFKFHHKQQPLQACILKSSHLSLYTYMSYFVTKTNPFEFHPVHKLVHKDYFVTETVSYIVCFKFHPHKQISTSSTIPPLLLELAFVFMDLVLLMKGLLCVTRTSFHKLVCSDSSSQRTQHKLYSHCPFQKSTKTY